MKINWSVRFKNPVFLFQLLAAVAGPILLYYNLTYEDFTTWGKAGQVIMDAIRNPFVVGTIIFAAWNAINDPNIKGFRDSDRALNYEKPKDPRGL